MMSLIVQSSAEDDLTKRAPATVLPVGDERIRLQKAMMACDAPFHYPTCNSVLR